MEAVALSRSLTSLTFGTSAAAAATEKRGCATVLSYATPNNLNVRQLAAFHKQSHLFTKSATRPFLYPKSHVRKSTHGNDIFLLHLVASLEQVEQTYIMVKPDGVQRGLAFSVASDRTVCNRVFERKGFKLTGLKLFQCPRELAEFKKPMKTEPFLTVEDTRIFAYVKAKPFYPKLINYITSGPVVCMALEGVGVVASARKLIGSTDPLQAEPGTIRGDLAVQTGRNVVHSSDSPENGKRETALWFKEDELCQWTPAQAPWLRE
ncbi:hypothetical protein PTKIN_Ptkin04bG0034000 [Pterospermum kingtungense]